VASGEKTGTYWECGLIPEDRRTVKPKQDNFLLAAMFFKNLSAKPAKVIKFTRKVDGEKQWDQGNVKTSVVTVSENPMKDIV